MRASGVRPSAEAREALISTTAAAPSLMPEALPAVTLPVLSKAGRKPASPSADDFWLTNSSVAKISGSPLRCGMLTPTISSLKRPACCAAMALSCDASAKASCASREMPNCLAMFSAVTPM